MADGIIYKDVILTAVVKKEVSSGETSYVLDLPFKVYGFDIVKGDELVSYKLDKLEGQTVLAKVDYLTSDEPIVLAYNNKVNFNSDKKEYGKYWPSNNKFCLALSFS